jgi:hypothetical protein
LKRHRALPGDIVELDFVDIKKQLPVARIRKIITRSARSWNARMLRREKGRVIMQLADVPGDIL